MQIRPERTDCSLRSFFPLATRNTCMVGMLSPGMGFFHADIALICHSPKKKKSEADDHYV
jgi:hypothetical protein